jgi:aminocarboxymuconate-semialdehyde decarboxylase
VHEAAKLDYLLKLVGADQIMLGSDYPFPLGEQHPGELIASMPYDEAIKSMLLSGTALNWLGIEPSRFVGHIK